MAGAYDRLLQRLETGPAVLVQVDTVQGSGPRETGAWMAVFADGEIASIGGGNLEHQAMAMARDWLKRGPPDAARVVPGQSLQLVGTRTRYSLGPSLGQCCGGVVWLRHVWLDPMPRELAHRLTQPLAPRGAPLALFGGGHVGTALMELLVRLPFDVRWIDSREAIFPNPPPAGVHCERSDPVQAAVASLPPGVAVLIMSFSHAEDLDIVAACLARQRAQADLRFIGLIGSKSKWATFGHRLEQRGYRSDELAQVTCPIGLPGLAGKEPETIAVSVAAQLLLLPAIPPPGPRTP